MRVSKAQAEQNRDRIIEVAAKLFRERGFDGVGVADLMKCAGLTHGGFYGHFASKEDLMMRASVRALEESLGGWQQVVEDSSENALSGVASAYLSASHRDRPGEGCALAALAADAARQGSPIRGAFTQGLRSVTDMLMRLMPGKSKRLRRQNALSICASMVGALVLARAVDDAELSDEVMQSVLALITRTDLFT